MTGGELAFLVLAAGKSTRMHSRVPKVLHPVCGRSIIHHVVQLGRDLGARRTLVVVGAGDEQVREALGGAGVEIVVQREISGTGQAVQQAREQLADHKGPVLVMYGDHPIYRPGTLRRLVDLQAKQGADLALLVGEFPDPSGYGRIVRGPGGGIEHIVEEVEASPEVRAIHEINLGVYVAPGPHLFDWVSRLSNENEQGEYYLTDVVEMALGDGHKVETCSVEDWTEGLGVNSRVDLAQAEKVLRRRLADHWMERGVTFVDPDHTYLDVDVEIGADSVIEAGATLRGATRLGERCRISAGSLVEDSTLGNDVFIKPHCWLESSRVGNDCVVGPSAHLRPDSVLENGVRIANYVEVKNSQIGAGTKADHLAYVGDADIGSGVTIGCGAITVNYDGLRKERTRVGDGAFIGCNANLIAPVHIEAGAYVAAGTTVTKDVPEKALGIGRAKQRNIPGWRDRRLRKKDRKD
jgi:bifunctional UDP-N-acetylglucosamine pyrophosphorylase/glucosamine-1-phosphate N-acetyltransferase